MIKKLKILLLCCIIAVTGMSQETYPVNGVADVRSNFIAFINATIVKDPQTTLHNATLVIKQGKIVSVGTNISVAKDAVVIDCRGKYIYPSFIDLFSNYGMPAPQTSNNTGDQPLSNTKGAYGWNQAIKTEITAANIFSINETKASDLRSAGFGAVVAHQQDGIARGTGALVSLANNKENIIMLKEKAAAFYSFNPGTSTQDYPSSLMGSIALLRQTFLDAQWYKNHPSTEGINLSLQTWNDNQNLPQIFEANDKWNIKTGNCFAQLCV